MSVPEWEIMGTTGNGRSCASPPTCLALSTYSADLVTVQFTGKERDAETGLDYFGARYFSGAQGRFASPDWSETPEPVPYADLTDPQTLNLYSYVRNNPLSRADADGHCPWCIGALIGGVGGGAASIISQKWSHPERDINWKQVGAAALGGAVRLVTYCPQGGTCKPDTSGALLFGYDADGRRVTKGAGSSLVSYVYDAAGQLAAEYGGASSSPGVTYLTVDPLGSTRAVTDGSGTELERRDYYAFGGQIMGTVGNGRSCASPPSSPA
jgi:RHS repeat-associated protein